MFSGFVRHPTVANQIFLNCCVFVFEHVVLLSTFDLGNTGLNVLGLCELLPCCTVAMLAFLCQPICLNLGEEHYIFCSCTRVKERKC